MTTRRRCPVCLRRVTRTARGNIAGHLDKTGHTPCPASFEIPYNKALADTPGHRP